MQTTPSSLTDRAEEALRSTASAAAHGMEATREDLQARMLHMRLELDDLQERAAHGTRRALRTTDQAVHAHPYRAVAVAAALGLLAGWLASRR